MLPDTGPGIPQGAALQPANRQACQNTPSEAKGCINYHLNGLDNVANGCRT